jgi:hypothetical protein
MNPGAAVAKLNLLLLAVLVACARPGHAEPPASVHPVIALEEQRYCGPPRRNAAGEIVRRADVLAAFRRAHPCPVSGLATGAGACPGWAIDHVIPLACGGCDAVSNLQWLPNRLKSTTTGKDRFERLIYCTPMQRVPQP